MIGIDEYFTFRNFFNSTCKFLSLFILVPLKETETNRVVTDLSKIKSRMVTQEQKWLEETMVSSLHNFNQNLSMRDFKNVIT